MKHLLYIVLLAVCVSVTSCSKQEVDQGELAAIAAKGYYDLLLEGKYEEFVAGYHQPYRIPAGYHEQLVTNAKMYVGQQKEEHKGIAEVRILNAKADTARHIADVFLYFVYGDSTKEQVIVPMVMRDGEWKMR